MDRVEAEENIKLIRNIMEQSARYTNFSGLSGVVAGMLAILGCFASYWASVRFSISDQRVWHVLIWACVLILALSQDFAFACAKAKRRNQSIWSPASVQVIRAVLPGIFAAFVVSLWAFFGNHWNVIPAIWALGYGVSDCAAGMFSVKEVTIFGIVQMITGAIGLFFVSSWTASLFLLGLTFGVYHIIFGLCLVRKYGR